jgi:gamma-glutamyltranspeptidase/glutathione hydrolase
MPQLAATLERVANEGASAFYGGAIASEIGFAVRDSGGILSTSDLANYRPHWRHPLRATYRGLEIVTMPPPSSGGVILEILNILAGDDLAALGSGSPAYLHLLAEAMKHGFADRARWYGDPEFTAVPVERLVSPGYGKQLRARIRDDAVAPQDRYGSTPDSGTTHLSVIDGDGMAVACTTTINTAFGAMLMAGTTGVLLNNEMDDFAIAPGVPNVFGLIGGEANAVGPGKRPLSSMTPVIVRDGGKTRLVAGGSGGPLIISGTLETVLGVVDFGLDAAAAVAAPRIHHQWAPPVLGTEVDLDPAVAADLQRRGHTLKKLPFAGAVSAVSAKDGRLVAAADPRKSGGAAAR